MKRILSLVCVLLLASLPALPQVPQSHVYSGQQAVTATAAALSGHVSNTVCVKALVGNSINVYVGPSGVTTSTGLELAPGDAVCQPISNTNLIYVVASTTGASVSWTATY